MKNRPFRQQASGRWITIALAATVCFCLAATQALSGSDKVSGVAQGLAKGKSKQDMLELIVTYDSRPGHLERQRVRDLGGKAGKLLKQIDGLAVRLPAEAVEVLADDPGVKWITVDAKVKVNLDVARDVSTLTEAIAQPGGYTGAGVTVAVLDTGVYEHTDIEDRGFGVDIVGTTADGVLDNRSLAALTARLE